MNGAHFWRYNGIKYDPETLECGCFPVENTLLVDVDTYNATEEPCKDVMVRAGNNCKTIDVYNSINLCPCVKVQFSMH